MDFLSLPLLMAQRLEVGWTMVLYMTRFTALFILLPGIGAGMAGMVIRMPSIIILSLVSVSAGTFAAVPSDPMLMAAQVFSEVLFGSLLGLFPALIVAAVQTGMQLASVSMGLGASQLIDPTSGAQVSDISRIYAEVVIIMFLLVGGHHVVIYAASGMGGEILPGSFLLSEQTIELLINRTGYVLHLGMIISAPIIVALLLTQFVMGLVTRAIPTVNIFIISYPLTIGIGLILSILAFPEVMRVMGREFLGLDTMIDVITAGMKRA